MRCNLRTVYNSFVLLFSVKPSAQLLHNSSTPALRALFLTRRRLLTATRRHRAERKRRGNLPQLAACACVWLDFRGDDWSGLALADRRVVVYVILAQINFPRQRNVRILNRGSGVAYATADFAAEVHGAVGVVVPWEDPCS
jgi:hypothetical protein